MRLIWISFVLITHLFVSPWIQTIPDSEFKWKKLEGCFPKGRCAEVYLKVDKNPVLSQFPKSEFDSLIARMVTEICNPDKTSGILKLKILFAAGQPLCVTHVGTKGFLLSDGHMEMIQERLSEISEFKSGRQRGVEVDCLGILYIDIMSGQVTKTRNINFDIT